MHEQFVTIDAENKLAQSSLQLYLTAKVLRTPILGHVLVR